MGIARAIERVKQQAKRGGLNAMMAGLGEELRSRAIPAPLRGAAQRIAALLDRERPARGGAASESGDRAPAPSRDDARAIIGVPEGEHEELRMTVRPEVPLTAMDSGAEPTPPDIGEPVDAKVVGATPTYNATPVDATPLDATPVDATPIDAAPLEFTPLDAKPINARPVDEVVASDPAAEPPIDPTALEETLAKAGAPDEPGLTEATTRQSWGNGAPSEPVVMAAVIEDVNDEDVKALDEDVRDMDDEVTLVTTPQASAVTVPAPSLQSAAAATTTSSKGKSRSRGGQGGRKRTPAEPRPQSAPGEKEKLAADSEAAKTLARSSSRGAKKRQGAKADTSKKK